MQSVELIYFDTAMSGGTYKDCDAAWRGREELSGASLIIGSGHSSLHTWFRR